MTENIRSTHLERKLYTAYHQDGLLDIVVGIALLLFSGVMLFDQSAFVGLIALPLAMYIPLKQQITYPRQGFIRFMPERESRRFLFLALVLGTTMLMGMVLFYALSGGVPDSIATLLTENIRVIFGLALALVLFGTAFFLNNIRFYYYSAISILTLIVAQITQIPLGLVVAGLGLLVLGTGLFKLQQFLREYPLPEADPNEQ